MTTPVPSTSIGCIANERPSASIHRGEADLRQLLFHTLLNGQGDDIHSVILRQVLSVLERPVWFGTKFRFIHQHVGGCGQDDQLGRDLRTHRRLWAYRRISSHDSQEPLGSCASAWATRPVAVESPGCER